MNGAADIATRRTMNPTSSMRAWTHNAILMGTERLSCGASEPRASSTSTEADAVFFSMPFLPVPFLFLCAN